MQKQGEGCGLGGSAPQNTKKTERGRERWDAEGVDLVDSGVGGNGEYELGKAKLNR